MKATGYSLWLEPEKGTEAYISLHDLIQRLARDIGSPVFPPHVTVLGGVQGDYMRTLSRSELVALRNDPFEVRLGKLGSQNEHLRGFYSEVDQTEPVMMLNKKAAGVFGLRKNYFPHLSLSYFDHKDSHAPDRLRQATAGLDLSKWNFVARSVKLYRTEGPVSEWCKLFEYRFVG